MRWKYSLLTDEERKELDDWIAEDLMKKEEESKHPWKATRDVDDDELAKENDFIQRYLPIPSPNEVTS